VGSASQAFLTGLLHPLLLPAHALALIGLAALAGSAKWCAWSIAAFAISLVGGLVAVAWGVGETPANYVLLGAAALCGLDTAALPRVPAWIAVVAAAVVGAAIGLDSPPEVISLRDAALMLAGVGCGGILTLALLAAIAAGAARLWQGVPLRVAGSWVTAIAVLVLALRLAS
jgi:urease accessory protein